MGSFDPALPQRRGRYDDRQRYRDSPNDATLPPEELAAWTIVASQIMNLDEALTK